MPAPPLHRGEAVALSMVSIGVSAHPGNVPGASSVPQTIARKRAGIDNRHCHYCGKSCPPKQITRDHVIPRGLGGQDHYLNLVPSCGPCNSAKACDPPTCECERCVDAYQYHRDLIEYRRRIQPAWAEAMLAQLGDELVARIYALTTTSRFEARPQPPSRLELTQ